MRICGWSSDVCSSDLIIDDDSARPGCLGRIDLRGTGACRKQRNVPPGEIEMLDILDLQLAAGFAKVNFHTLLPRRSNGCDFVCRKFALGKDVQHFTAYIARGADDDYPITHFGAFPSIDSKTAGFLRNRRSEKHTSELQSLMRISYAVFCLKKKRQLCIPPK